MLKHIWFSVHLELPILFILILILLLLLLLLLLLFDNISPDTSYQ